MNVEPSRHPDDTKTNVPHEPHDPKSDIPRPELAEEAQRAEERVEKGKPVRNATREPSSIALDRAADEGMVPADEDG